MPRRLSSQLFTLVTAFGFCASASATELGEARVSSHIGQQLVADIEITAIDDTAAPVQARLASADVYKGANTDVPAALSSLTMSVMRRDGKQFLHVTSLKPVEADHLHLFVELNDGGRRSVRLSTLWFTPDPTPPAPPAARPAPVAAAAEATPPPAPKKAPPPRPAPVAAAAEPAPPPAPKKAPRPRPAPVAPAAEPAPQPLPWKAPPRPAAVHLAPAPIAPACKPQPAATPQPDPVCAALDHKNADLRAQISKLEEKVKALQSGAKRKAAEAAAAVPVRAEKARPGKHSGVAPAAMPLVQLPSHDAPRLAPAPAQRPALPWGWIAGAGAAVFTLIGSLQLWRTRRARAIANLKANMKARASPLVPRDAQPTAEPTLG